MGCRVTMRPWAHSVSAPSSPPVPRTAESSRCRSTRMRPGVLRLITPLAARSRAAARNATGVAAHRGNARAAAAIAAATVASSLSFTWPMTLPSMGESTARRCPWAGAPSIRGAASDDVDVPARISARSEASAARSPNSMPAELGRVGA